MTADKINEIKRKIYKKKMATVGEIENIAPVKKVFLMLFSNSMFDCILTLLKDKSSFVEADAAVTREILTREKLLQTRATALLSDTKVIII